MSSSKLNRQSTTRTAGSPIADATRSVDQRGSARGRVLTSLTLSALGFPGTAYEEGSREGVVRHRHRRLAGRIRRDRLCHPPAQSEASRERSGAASQLVTAALG